MVIFFIHIVSYIAYRHLKRQLLKVLKTHVYSLLMQFINCTFVTNLAKINILFSQNDICRNHKISKILLLIFFALNQFLYTLFILLTNLKLKAMRKFNSLVVLALMWFAATTAFADEHRYENGICTMHDECAERFQQPEQDADGYYLLYNAGNVEWISQLVLSGVLDPYCKLMNDIDFQNIENLHSPIGPDNGKKYNGTFDGQGFRIKNMIINLPDRERVGFFGTLRGNPNSSRQEGTVVKNLIIDKSCSITGGKRTGGITGSGQNKALEINIINCVNEATITTPSNNGAGIVGGSEGDHPAWKITNCVNVGTIISTASNHEAAGISAWLGDNGSTRVTNCINIGEILDVDGNSGMDGSGRGVFRHSNSDATAVNCYDFSNMELATQFA